MTSAREAEVSFTKLTLGHPLAAGRTHVATIDVKEEGIVKSAIPSFVVKVLLGDGGIEDLEAIGHEVFRVLWECEFERQMPLWTPPWPI